MLECTEPRAGQIQSSCHHCSACSGGGDDVLNDDSSSGVIAAGYETILAALLFFLSPAALMLVGVSVLGSNAAMRCLGGAIGFTLGIMAAYAIARLMWKTDCEH